MKVSDAELKKAFVSDVLTRYVPFFSTGRMFEAHVYAMNNTVIFPRSVWRVNIQDSEVAIPSKKWWPWLLELESKGLVIKSEHNRNIWWRAATPHEIVQHKLKAKYE